MNLSIRRWGALLVLCSLALTFGTAMAANEAQVVVLNDGAPMEGMLVEMYGSSGIVSGITDSEGMATVDLDGTMFRIRVNGEVMVDGLYAVDNGPVTVDLAQ